MMQESYIVYSVQHAENHVYAKLLKSAKYEIMGEY